MNRKQRAIEHAFWKANKIGDEVNLYEIIDSYKTLSNASEEEVEAINNYLADRLGFSASPLLSSEQEALLRENGYYPPTW
ncbi:hypothetical protein [Aneurinibacillus aneurinilyticus]|uniref:hypothetical protein n=1 Tax=Aneurinibacillus aneurinilyticus TaxID=1391 RepID=UPI0023F369A4|nr:hypothetical protein [Aneurinibacillus aneurinilyticus]